MGVADAVWTRTRLGRRLLIGRDAADPPTAPGQPATRARTPAHSRLRFDARRAITAALRPLPHIPRWGPWRRTGPAAAIGRSDVEYALSREELQPLLPALRKGLGWGSAPLDSPARLEEALEALVARLGGDADVTVRRSPATLMSPEYWHIRFGSLDRRTHEALEPLLGRERR